MYLKSQRFRNICSVSAFLLRVDWQRIERKCVHTSTREGADTRSVSNASSTLRPETFYGANSPSCWQLYDGFATWLARALARTDIFGALMRYKKPGFIEHAGLGDSMYRMNYGHVSSWRALSGANETFSQPVRPGGRACIRV